MYVHMFLERSLPQAWQSASSLQPAASPSLLPGPCPTPSLQGDSEVRHVYRANCCRRSTARDKGTCPQMCRRAWSLTCPCQAVSLGARHPGCQLSYGGAVTHPHPPQCPPLAAETRQGCRVFVVSSVAMRQGCHAAAACELEMRPACRAAASWEETRWGCHAAAACELEMRLGCRAAASWEETHRGYHAAAAVPVGYLKHCACLAAWGLLSRQIPSSGRQLQTPPAGRVAGPLVILCAALTLGSASCGLTAAPAWAYE